MIRKKFEKNNVTVALNVSCAKKEKIYSIFVPKHNLNCEKQVILLMIPHGVKRKIKCEGQRWHCLAVKNLSALLRGMKSKHCDNFYCLNCLHFLEQKANLNHIKKYVKTKIFVMLKCLLRSFIRIL